MSGDKNGRRGAPLQPTDSGYLNQLGESLETPSSAQALVQLAAYRIDLAPNYLSAVIKKLDQEFVTEIWQLKFLDSANWKALGAPIGLVAAVRASLQEKEATNSVPDPAEGINAYGDRFSEITDPLGGVSEHSIDHRTSKRSSTGMLYPSRPLQAVPQHGKRSSTGNAPLMVPHFANDIGDKDLPPVTANRRISVSEASASVSTIQTRSTLPSTADHGGDAPTKKRGSNDGQPSQPERRRTLNRYDEETIRRAMDIVGNESSSECPARPCRRDTLIKTDSDAEQLADDVLEEEGGSGSPVQPKRRSTIQEASREEEEDSDVESSKS